MRVMTEEPFSGTEIDTKTMGLITTQKTLLCTVKILAAMLKRSSLSTLVTETI